MFLGFKDLAGMHFCRGIVVPQSEVQGTYGSVEGDRMRALGIDLLNRKTEHYLPSWIPL